jgi:hypothetical protein
VVGEQETIPALRSLLSRRAPMVTTYWLIACLVLVCTIKLPLAAAASGSTNNWAVLVCSVSSTPPPCRLRLTSLFPVEVLVQLQGELHIYLRVTP